MSDYKPTTIADVLTHVGTLKADTEREYKELSAHGDTLRFGSDEDRYNDQRKNYLAGQLLAIAKIEGYLEARIQIDEIWSDKTTGEILDGNLQYDLGTYEVPEHQRCRLEDM